MLKGALVLALLVSRQALAFGGTSEAWLGGTQPWDTVPYFEANLGLQASGGQGASHAGPLAQIGLLDQVMVAGAWSFAADGSAGRGEGSLVVREASFPTWRPALALATRVERDPDLAWQPLMVVAAIEPWDHSLVLNYEPWGDVPLFRMGYWTPYLVSFLRLGLEAQNGARFDGPWIYTPQLTLQAPGDLSAVLGVALAPADPGAWTASVRLSYQLFPSP